MDLNRVIAWLPKLSSLALNNYRVRANLNADIHSFLDCWTAGLCIDKGKLNRQKVTWQTAEGSHRYWKWISASGIIVTVCICCVMHARLSLTLSSLWHYLIKTWLRSQGPMAIAAADVSFFLSFFLSHSFFLSRICSNWVSGRRVSIADTETILRPRCVRIGLKKLGQIRILDPYVCKWSLLRFSGGRTLLQNWTGTWFVLAPPGVWWWRWTCWAVWEGVNSCFNLFGLCKHFQITWNSRFSDLTNFRTQFAWIECQPHYVNCICIPAAAALGVVA